MTDGAVVGAALGNRGTPDPTSTAGRAALTRPGVHSVLALELAGPPVDPDVLGIRQRRPPGGDRLSQHVHDRRGQSALSGEPETVATTSRSETSAVADLIGVDVADAGDERLVEEQRFQRATSAPEARSESGEVEAVAKGIRSEAREFRHLVGYPHRIEDDDLSEGSRIHEEHAAPIVKTSVDVGVRGRDGFPVDEEDLSAHAEMDHR